MFSFFVNQNFQNEYNNNVNVLGATKLYTKKGLKW